MAELARNVQAMAALIGGPAPAPRGQGDVAGPSGLQRPARIVEPTPAPVEPTPAPVVPAAAPEPTADVEQAIIIDGELVITPNLNHGIRYTKIYINFNFFILE